MFDQASSLAQRQCRSLGSRSMREARAFMISRRVDVAPPSAARELREFGLRRGRSAHAPVSASRVSSSFGVRPHRRPLRVSGACLHLAHNCSPLPPYLPPQLATTEAAAEKFRKKTPVLYHVGFSSVLSFHTRSVSQSGQFRCGPPALTTPSAHLSVSIYFKFLFLFTAEEKYTCIDW